MPLKGVDKCYCRWGSIGGGHCHAKEGHFSALAWDATFFRFSYFFFFFFFFFFQNYFRIVTARPFEYYSTWTPKSNLHNLARRWRELRRLGRLRTSSLPLLWPILFQVQHNEPTSSKCQYSSKAYSRLSLSRIPRDSLKYFEISVVRHIRFAELRKTIGQPPLTEWM